MELIVALTPKNSFKKLYSDKDPRIFVSRATSLVHSNSSVVRSALPGLTKEDEMSIIKTWALPNEFQMKSVFERFASFLLSQLTANSYLFYVPITDVTDVTESKLKKVAEFFKLSSSDVVDELIAFRFTLAHDGIPASWPMYQFRLSWITKKPGQRCDTI